jgi:proline iminopeptidase
MSDNPFFPPIEPFASGMLPLQAPYEMYWEESGAPEGIPVLFLHGGPGSGCSPKHRHFFDPAIWRVVIHDQRGCGRSTPVGDLSNNTTQALIADIEALREARGIERWMVFGGSWGSTLSLAYAEAHPDRCLGLVVRGIFLGERAENDWFMTGMALLSPEAWRDFAVAAGKSEDDKTSLLEAYVTLLNDPDPAINGPAAEAWGLYEARSSTLLPNPDLMAEMSGPAKALALARIEAHYFRHDCFLSPGQLLAGVAKIRHLPATIVQGRYDLLCPIGVADRLSQAWPEAEYVVVPDAGHSAFEPGIARELVAAVQRMAKRIG